MRIFVGACLVIMLASCGVKVPFTKEMRDQYNLVGDKEMRKVQFYTSQTVILTRSIDSGSKGTTDDGTLVSSQSSEEDRVIIPANTKCVFDGFGSNGELLVRFEVGVGKSLNFAIRPNQNSTKYYLSAEWGQPKGGKLTYGNESYFVPAEGGSTFLMVKKKNLQKTKRKGRVVKGMKV